MEILTRTITAAIVLIGSTSTLWAQSVDFNRDVRPILSNRCLACHGPDSAHREAGLRLDDAASATVKLESGKTAVVTGQPDASELIRRITTSDDDARMPPAHFGKPLTEKEIAVLRRWIAEGAPFAKHWSYVPAVRPDVPSVDNAHAQWPANAIDHFVLRHMIEHQLKPSAQADARTLVRRVFLDLIGVPPTIEEADTWTQRLSPGAAKNDLNEVVWSELVDHLLSRPEFGEHWARKWLDLARYADSSGYADDPARVMWPWRDWVIRSINSGMPFDQFTIEQMAGDMLPNPTEDQIIATGFHRNTMTNNEGGTQDEEFRNVAIVDRVNTTMAVWMGTTFNCAQCHSHKYDPISQDEYFQVFAILNNTEDADRGDDSPKLTLFTSEQQARKAAIESRLAEIGTLFATPTPELVKSQADWERRLTFKPQWNTLSAQSIRLAKGGDAAVAPDGTVIVPGPSETNEYSLEFAAESWSNLNPGKPDSAASAIRLETVPDASLPGAGAGFGGGNFVITELKAQWIPPGASTPSARYLRITIPGTQKILSLAEVQVFSGGSNIAGSGVATQSSTDFDGPAQYAIDGNTDGTYERKSVTHTAISDNPWWELDLKEAKSVERVAIWNRLGNGIHTRLSNFQIQLLDDNRREVWAQTIADAPNPSAEYSPSNIRDIRFRTAIASFQQDGFSAEEVLDGKSGAENGWAVGGRVTTSHSLILLPEEPLPATPGATLRIMIEQNAPYANHVLGRFRVGVTGHPAAIERAKVPADVLAIADMAVADRSAEQNKQLEDWYRRFSAPELDGVRSEAEKLKEELSKMKPDASVLVMKELQGDARRKTLFQFRGNYLDKGHEVHEGVPSVFSSSTPAEPMNRLNFAKWLVSDSNPLTPRVIANRYWEEVFGRGIVATSEEFGSQGELPTHPDLLDWLARELVESGWNTRHLLKLIVTSRAYRQSSKVTQESLAADPDNRWLSRGPRVRLSSEMVRDQALAAAGLLSRKMYGPPVKPPQPSLGLSAAFGSSTDWQTSMGEDRYRRAIYTTWRRSNPYPSMATFDAPNREVCTLRRNRTNTPLQALVTLNDPVYVEAAQALGRRMLQTEGTVEDQITFGVRCCLQRDPTPFERAQLVELFADSKAEYSADSAAAMKMATDPLGALPEGMKVEDAAAMAIVAGVMLNLDEMLLKR